MSASHPLSAATLWRNLGHRLRASDPRSIVKGDPVATDRSSRCKVPQELRVLSFAEEQAAREQVRGLVRRVFLSGFPVPARQIAFMPIDATTDVSEVCSLIARTLSTEVVSDICLLEAPRRFAVPHQVADRSGTVAGFRQMGKQLASNLWCLPGNIVWGDESRVSLAPDVSQALESLRSEFEYCVVQVPAMSIATATPLGQLSDGIVLVVQANVTRRIVARKAKELLGSANVPVIGTILCDRSYPIPESIYRRI